MTRINTNGGSYETGTLRKNRNVCLVEFIEAYISAVDQYPLYL